MVTEDLGNRMTRLTMYLFKFFELQLSGFGARCRRRLRQILQTEFPVTVHGQFSVYSNPLELSFSRTELL